MVSGVGRPVIAVVGDEDVGMVVAVDIIHDDLAWRA